MRQLRLHRMGSLLLTLMIPLLVGGSFLIVPHWPPAVTNVSQVNELPGSQCDLRIITCPDGLIDAVVGRLRNLRYIFVSPAATLTDGDIEKIAGLPKLGMLVICDATALTDRSFSRLAGVKSLRRLIVKKCHQITDEGASVFVGRRDLTLLYINDARSVTDETKSDLLTSLPTTEVSFADSM